ncbi:calcium-transporting P [Metschnikowia bicuspidata var. bicuspidata NRRL YB-4993]|uniref:Calcium-transporting ATPase n=1 Tax=Metschnikowia bicuspidata var. bicuspidata NRRL YB-4993 TaxID=869754 RepID=A0A1A0HB12_9ASCO|nr:calcium-transporting P [Metschnikowia bicuspidata var. bicuspidata NRRL YB-4993]OBA21180.1 calcium-transporting P [Metschnikowia bicuspidata var. bicuspidata NRRL YB-4993]
MSENPFLLGEKLLKNRLSTPSARYSQLSVSDTITELQTDSQNGLSNSQDILNRRLLHGINELSSDEEESLVMKFISSFYSDPLILLLIASAVLSFWMGNVDDAVSITLAITIVVTVGFVQEYRSEQSLQALNKLVPAVTKLTRNSNTSSVLASALVPGDLVHFSQGDRIPADIRLTEAVHLSIDESNLTGENRPVKKQVNAIPSIPSDAANHAPVTERTSIAFMGTLVRDGHGTGIVVATGSQTEFGVVFEMMSEIEKPKTPLQQAMDKLGKDLSIFSFIVIGIIFLLGIIQGRAWLDMFQISVSLAVAAIPEGLPIIVTVTLALGVLRMAKRKAIVRRLPSVETLGSVNVICSDKTGTLTQNHMTVTKTWAFDFKSSGSFNSPFLLVDKLSDNTLHHSLTPNMTQVLEVGNICNNSKFSRENDKYVGNASDIAIMECLPHFGLEDMRGTKQRVYELPFSSERKFMAICVHGGDINKSETHVKGATEAVLKMCTRYLDESGNIQNISEDILKRIHENSTALASEGLRVLAFAKNRQLFTDEKEIHSPVPSNLVFCGLIGMKDPPRPNVGHAISMLMKGGVHVIMITGDSPSTAANIAKQIGIPFTSKDSIMTGDQLDSLDEESLSLAIHNVSVFARTTPEHKVTIVKALQRRGDIVAMTGDGVNDAPALKLADIGIAMGKNGTDVAKEAADMVLTDDDFSTILCAIEEGKGIFYNIQNFVTFQLSTSIAALTLIALATFFGLPNPLNAMQILWINILMDGPPAQSLGVEPVDHEVMNKPPRKRNDKILTQNVIKRVLQSAAMIILGTLYIFIREMQDNQITARDTTMTFTCFVFFDMFNALSCRHYSKSLFELGFTNPMFNFAVLGSLFGQLCAIYVPFFQSIFQTEALTLRDLINLLIITSTVFIGDEVRKYLLKRRTMYNGFDYNV